METALVLVIIGGAVVLVVLAMAVGAELDTEEQRRIRKQVAEERRLLRQELSDADRAQLCQRCPFRRRG